jgi:hypothetical protein
MIPQCLEPVADEVGKYQVPLLVLVEARRVRMAEQELGEALEAI